MAAEVPQYTHTTKDKINHITRNTPEQTQVAKLPAAVGFLVNMDLWALIKAKLVK